MMCIPRVIVGSENFKWGSAKQQNPYCPGNHGRRECRITPCLQCHARSDHQCAQLSIVSRSSSPLYCKKHWRETLVCRFGVDFSVAVIIVVPLSLSLPLLLSLSLILPLPSPCALSWPKPMAQWGRWTHSKTRSPGAADIRSLESSPRVLRKTTCPSGSCEARCERVGAFCYNASNVLSKQRYRREAGCVNEKRIQKVRSKNERVNNGKFDQIFW